MLVILTTHPIQYQVPIWQMLAREGRVPFEVWYLSDHGAQARTDREFGRRFAWDIDLTRGYPHRFLDRAEVTAPDSFWDCRLRGSFAARLRGAGASALWLQFGVISTEGAEIAERAGLKVVMDRCMKVEHARHLGRMHWLGLNTGVVTSQRQRSL